MYWYGQAMFWKGQAFKWKAIADFRGAVLQGHAGSGGTTSTLVGGVYLGGGRFARGVQYQQTPPTSTDGYQQQMGCEEDPASCPGGSSDLGLLDSVSGWLDDVGDWLDRCAGGAMDTVMGSIGMVTSGLAFGGYAIATPFTGFAALGMAGSAVTYGYSAVTANNGAKELMENDC